MSALPTRQVPGVYHRRLGSLLVTALSDGYIDPPADAPRGVTPEAAHALMLAGTGQPGTRISVNAFVIRGGGRTLLVDAGSGATMGPSCGRLPENLHAAGVSEEEVDAILLTHVHPDHSNGITSDEGVALFPRATIHVHAAEMAHWFDDTAMAAATERSRTRYFEAARFRLAPYRDRISTFTDGTVFPGIAAVPCPGHTPGHSAFRITTPEEEMLIWGDTVHVPELQVPQPDITMLYDADPPMAAASRRAIFELVVREGLLVGGMHLHFPGFGRLAHGNGEYRVLTEPWRYEV